METIHFLIVISIILTAQTIIDTVLWILRKKSRHMWEIIVPAAKNKQEFSSEFHKQWDEKVAAISSDIVILRPLKGDWLTSNIIPFSEKVLRVNVVCTTKQLKEIIGFTIDHYQMENVVMFRTGENVIIESNKSA
jgi:hypothetical protein